MVSITQEAQRLIERDSLGIPTEIYKPNIVGSIVISSIIMAIGIGWSLVAAFVINGLDIFTGTSSFPGIDPLSAVPTILGIVFPLFGLLFVAIGLIGIVKATLNRHNQAVVCTDGVAYVTRESADAFRWEQVLMVFNKTSVSTSTTRNEQGFASTHSSIDHKYSVHCHDGRKFVFDDTLNRVEDLAEKIEVEVVRRGGTVK